MRESKRYRPNNSRFFNRLLRLSYGAWLKGAYNVRAVGLEVFDRIKPPYLLVPAHASLIDPFIIGSSIRDPVYWVTGDGNMRTSLMRFILRLVGSIPKTKAIPDIETIGHIVEVVRKKKGVVGLFAEGQSTWSGRTQAIYKSTAKLVKLLKAPTIVVIPKGAYLSLPRWAWRRRRGELELEFKLLFEEDDLRELDSASIQAKLEEAMRYDEYDWIRTRTTRWSGRARAENLELALFLCPECGSVGSLRSFRNRFHCASCGASARLNRRGGFTQIRNETDFRFKTIGEWDAWQAGAFKDWVAARSGKPGRALFGDAGVALLRGHKLNPLRLIRTGTLALYPDRIELLPLISPKTIIPLAGLTGIGTLKQHILEFYEGKSLYQVRFTRKWCSARKWQAAVETLAELRGEGGGEAAGRAFS